MHGRLTLERRASSAGATVGIAGRSVTTGASGDYLLTDVSAGIYTLSVRCAGYLRSWRQVTVAGGQLLEVPPVTLLAGDINGDDHIDLVDGALIGLAWNTTAGGAGWDPRPDINQDGVINILDRVAVQYNWDAVAPGPWPDAP